MGFLSQKIRNVTSTFSRNQPAFVAGICKLAGIYPVQLLPEDQRLRKWYTIYSHALIVMIFICLMSFCAELFCLFHAETLMIDEVLKNLCLLTPLTMTAFRQAIIRSSADGRKMLKNAENVVRRVYEENDPEVVRVFEKAGQVSMMYYFYYAIGTIFMCLACFLDPLYHNEDVFSGNATVSCRQLPVPVWIPYDTQTHYWATFFFTILIICLLGVFQVSMDVLFFYLIRCPVAQLEILHHFLKHFNYHTGRISVSSNIMMTSCIETHQQVIEFVDIFNKNFSNIMILDFVQSSIRIASIGAVVKMTESFAESSFVFTIIYFWLTLVREYYIYHAGNEINFLSSELAHSVYETEWYEENRQFKYMVAMFMLRAGKPLQIKIGPFGNLGLPALLAIVRASFSYFSLVTGVQKS